MVRRNGNVAKHFKYYPNISMVAIALGNLALSVLREVYRHFCRGQGLYLETRQEEGKTGDRGGGAV